MLQSIDTHFFTTMKCRGLSAGSQCTMVFHRIVCVHVFAKKKACIALIVILTTIAIVFVASNDNQDAWCSEDHTSICGKMVTVCTPGQRT